MAAGLVVPVSGPYVGTWNSLPFGTLNDDGFILNCTIQGQEVNLSDAYGMTLTEAIYRGQNWRCRIRGLEWNKTGLLALLQQFGARVAGQLTPILTNIGDLYTTYSKVMVLTAILANPPTVPQTLTATNASIAPNSQSEFMFTSKLREMPLELVLIPYSTVIGSQTFNVPFTTT